jgi:hypothetical protein
LKTRVCELLGIEHPFIQAGMSIFTRSWWPPCLMPARSAASAAGAVPQVVDAVRPLPVVAAGGIARSTTRAKQPESPTSAHGIIAPCASWTSTPTGTPPSG